MPESHVSRHHRTFLHAIPAEAREHVGSSARTFVTLGEARGEFVPAVRISFSVALPLVILLLLGRLDLSLFASFGTFSSLYGRFVPTRERVRQQAIAGSALVACEVFATAARHVGALVPTLPGAWIVVIVGTIVAALTSGLVPRFGLRPRGVLFFVFASTAITTSPHSFPLWVPLLVGGGSVLISLAFSALFHVLGEANTDRAVPAPERVSRADYVQDAGRFSSAALLAGSISTALMIPSPYWAQVAAVAPLSETRRLGQVNRALHRVVGTVLGVVIAAFLMSFPSEPWQTVVWIVVMQFLAEMFVTRNYSLGLVFVTPLALLMVHLANPERNYEMLVPRIVETSIGACVGIAVVVFGLIVERRWASRKIR
ncbi:FUSC family protein [Dermabacter sp. HSID17554]|uniref:FUSC family protein n=1 Tax=Dermabacter sp. HSID17554 TaxID=2419511 RepID=UPI000F8924F2|nr:FUSC family protein [Dermabacter sp. HSID17554]